MKSIKEDKGKGEVYPYMATNSGLVVVFTSFEKGMIVHKEDDASSIREIGYTSTTWNERKFIRYDGKVVLSND